MYFGHLFLSAHRDGYTSPNCVPVASLPRQLNGDPVAAIALVQQDSGWALHIVDDDVNAAVAIQVGKRGSAANPQNSRQGFFLYLGEFTVAALHEKLATLCVSLAEALAFDLRVNVAVRHE